MKKKNELHHEILNALTLANCLVEEEQIARENKANILNTLRTAALMIRYEDILLGKRARFLIREVSVTDTVAMALEDIFDQDHPTARPEIALPDDNVLVQIDELHFRAGMACLLEECVRTATQMAFDYDSEKNILHIRHDGTIPELAEGCPDGTSRCQIGQKLLQALGIVIRFKANVISLIFPTQTS